MLKRILRLIARCFTVALLTSVIFLLSCQSKLMYFPRPYDKADLADIMQRKGRRIEAITSQGRQVAFYLPSTKNPDRAPDFLWLVFGGNGSLSLDYSGEPLHWDPRFGYLFVDYPGYGLCEGHPNPDRIKESILALVGELRTDLKWSPEDLQKHSGVIGHSLGCSAALIAADNLHLSRAVLCAPFTTMTDMARRTVGWPLCYLNMHRYNNLARLRELDARGARVRVFHGQKDGIIPVAMSRQIAATFPKTVRLMEVPDCGHGEIVMSAGVDIGKAMEELSDLPPR